MNIDPILKAAMHEIESVCEKYDVAGHFTIVSKTHAESRWVFARWVLVDIKRTSNGNSYMHIGLRKDKELESGYTLHFLTIVRSIAGATFSLMDRQIRKIREMGTEFTEGPLTMTPHDPDGA